MIRLFAVMLGLSSFVPILAEPFNHAWINLDCPKYLRFTAKEHRAMRPWFEGLVNGYNLFASEPAKIADNEWDAFSSRVAHWCERKVVYSVHAAALTTTMELRDQLTPDERKQLLQDARTVSEFVEAFGGGLFATGPSPVQGIVGKSNCRDIASEAGRQWSLGFITGVNASHPLSAAIKKDILNAQGIDGKKLGLAIQAVCQKFPKYTLSLASKRFFELAVQSFLKEYDRTGELEARARQLRYEAIEHRFWQASRVTRISANAESLPLQDLLPFTISAFAPDRKIAIDIIENRLHNLASNLGPTNEEGERTFKQVMRQLVKWNELQRRQQPTHIATALHDLLRSYPTPARLKHMIIAKLVAHPVLAQYASFVTDLKGPLFAIHQAQRAVDKVRPRLDSKALSFFRYFEPDNFIKTLASNYEMPSQFRWYNESSYLRKGLILHLKKRDAQNMEFFTQSNGFDLSVLPNDPAPADRPEEFTSDVVTPVTVTLDLSLIPPTTQVYLQPPARLSTIKEHIFYFHGVQCPENLSYCELSLRGRSDLSVEDSINSILADMFMGSNLDEAAIDDPPLSNEKVSLRLIPNKQNSKTVWTVTAAFGN